MLATLVYLTFAIAVGISVSLPEIFVATSFALLFTFTAVFASDGAFGVHAALLYARGGRGNPGVQPAEGRCYALLVRLRHR